MMRRSAVLILALGCLALAAAAQSKAVDVNGNWEFTMTGGPDGPGGPPGGGDRPAMIMTFVQKGDVLEVSMTGGPEGQEMKGTGKISGHDIEFTFTMTGGPMGDMTIVHKGKVDGETMKGTVALGEMGEMECTAKRVQK